MKNTEGLIIGFGSHRNGASTWDGLQDSFSQFVNDSTYTDLTTKDHGIYKDVGAFYDSGKAANKLNPLVRFMFGFFTEAPTKKLQSYVKLKSLRGRNPARIIHDRLEQLQENKIIVKAIDADDGRRSVYKFTNSGK